MLREPQHERNIINDINFPLFVPSSSSGLALSSVEGLREVFQQSARGGAEYEETQLAAMASQ
jgi:hypothetical protein